MTHPKTIYLKDYKKPNYLIPNIELTITLDDTKTHVKSKLILKKQANAPIILNGEHLTLLSVKKDGTTLSENDYTLTDTHLEIPNENDTVTLEIETQINPKENLALEGIYKSDTIICSQNEPEGFRRITYFIDRPDIMSSFKTTLIGDKTQYPLLLSNGNPIERKDLDNNQHLVTWEDPFPKPCYLFAVVAGDLGKITDTFTTKSGREVLLEIYCDKGNEERCWHAMESLKKSMKWDEDVYGLEYDLDIFMVVAVDAFNMGAMENKGLNIFNAAYILADSKTATDQDYKNIEAVVAHEYFHNWTGNRVTCRDWFQLTLKEGLTVFRDQEFSSDMNVRVIERIENIRRLRDFQFSEDSGPMSHPIRPESYIEINNFYTSTVYEKGSEIIRMIHTLIGPENFRKGIDIYFENFDGQAITTEDFIWAMAQASGFDFNEFSKWYHQAGTPICNVTKASKDNKLTLTIQQKYREKPFFYPLSIGLISKEGNELHNETLIINKDTHTFTFNTPDAIPSLGRNFSAPIIINYNYSKEDLITLMTHDTDNVNQYEAAFRLSTNEITNAQTSTEYLEAFGKCLDNPSINPALKAEMLSLPSLTSLLEPMDILDIDNIHKNRTNLKNTLAKTHAPLFQKWVNKLHTTTDYAPTPEQMADRSLKNLCLSYLSEAGCDYIDLIYHHFKTATNMTDELAALRILSNHNTSETKAAIQEFWEKYKNYSLIMNKWFAIQASSSLDTTFETVQSLANHPSFDNKNPNKLRALYGAFAGNLPHFHHTSGQGYTLLANQILTIDTFNPSIASRLSYAFKKYTKLDPHRKPLMKTQLEKILNTKNLSKNTFEIVNKINT